MDIYKWNDLLWRIVSEQLYKPGSNLYLAFDESILDEGAYRLIGVQSDESSLSYFNRVVRAHCPPVNASVIGLSPIPDGEPIRDNWGWVFDRGDRGRSLCLTFAAHQIFATEMMQGVSFYAAYWHAFGVEPDENRINPFGDRGRNSFRKLWEQLRTELRAELSLSPEQITFEYGSGSNKYRNLPISQSLLNEKDLATLSLEISCIEDIDDEALYAQMTHVRLSPSGTRKVLGGALRNQLVKQFRDHTSNAIVSPTIDANVDPVVREEYDIEGLLLTAEQETFGGEVVHVTAPHTDTLVTDIIAEHFKDYGSLIFQREDYSAKPLKKTLLPETGSEIWILLPVTRINHFLGLQSPRPSGDLLREFFSVVETSLPERYGIVHCHYLPPNLESVDIAVEPLVRIEANLEDRIEVALDGGICVNSASSSYLCGFGPTVIRVGSEVLKGSEKCHLDFEPKTVEDTLDELASVRYPRLHILQVRGVQKRIQFVDLLPREDRTTCYFTDWCLLPPVCARGRYSEGMRGLDCLLSVFDLDDFRRRYHKRSLIERELLSQKIEWLPIDDGQVTSYDVMLGYLDVPNGLRSMIRDRLKHARLVPVALTSNRTI